MNAVIFIAVLVGLVWAAVYLMRGSLVYGCLAFLVVGLCFGHELVSFDVGPIPLTLDRLVLAGVVVAYAVHRWLGIADPKPITRVEVVLLAFAGLLMVSTLASDWRVDAPGKVSPIWQLVAGYLMPVTVYWIARQSRLNKQTLLVVYGCLTALGIYLAITALAEITQQWWLVFPKQIASRDCQPGGGNPFWSCPGTHVTVAQPGDLLGRVPALCLDVAAPSASICPIGPDCAYPLRSSGDLFYLHAMRLDRRGDGRIDCPGAISTWQMAAVGAGLRVGRRAARGLHRVGPDSRHPA